MVKINSQCQQGYSIGSYSPQSRHIEGQDAIVGHSKEKNEEPGNELEGVPGTAPAVMAWARDFMHHGGVMGQDQGSPGALTSLWPDQLAQMRQSEQI